jgi:hypothetical protein
MKTRLCNRCGNEYQYQRDTSVYCSDNCRVQAWKVSENVIDKLYVEYNHSFYRVKVYENTIWIERQQPRGEQQLSFDRDAFKAYDYDRKSWIVSDVIELLDQYEARIQQYALEDQLEYAEDNKALPLTAYHEYDYDDDYDDDLDHDPLDDVDWNNYEGDYSEFSD